ncbi:protein FAM200C-like [Macrobrachium rosenbergii]|uniref:protein FAM200C-like n=1 Tax=Macrobrachium rosenbergii TaxID=79674 RepID=UPI0034D4F100
MADNVTQQQTVALTITPVFSVALDESVDINDIPRLAVFARYSDTEVHEELCCLKPMYGTTKGEDILKAFTDHFENRGVDIGKIFAITTDGAPAMISSFVLKKVMTTVTKIVNFVVAHSPLMHRQFQAFLEEVDSVYKDIPLHCSVRWLSCGKVLERFVGCFDEIKVFLSEKAKTILSWKTEIGL